MNERDQALTETRVRIKDKAFRTIFVKFQKEGIHCYPAAATDPALATGDEYDVSFLANPHRHMFHFHVTVQVFHNDRDIEFIDFKHKIKQYVAKTWYDPAYGCCNFGAMSCEMIAEDLFNYFGLCRCSVSEDGEFFGIIEA